MSTYPRSSNPFEDDDDDFSYSKTNRNPSSGGYSYEDKRAQLHEQIGDSEDRSLQSTQRALASIYESEQMGIATAEELVRQGEQLDNIERKTDQINSNMKTTQKHLNSIKSIFGGIKNWWQGDKDKDPQPSTSQSDRPSRLKETVQQQKKESEDYSGFYEEEDLDQKFMAGARRPQGHQQMIQPITKSAREKEIDENLGMMSDGVSRLKMLAEGLGDEIELHNDKLDRISEKTDRANIKVTDQNRQMRQILRK